MKLICLIFLVVCSCKTCHPSIKVCQSFLDFYIPFSKHCWKYDYDHLNVSGIAQTWGFKTEEYSLTLEDGYIITVFRAYKNITKKNPVVLGHATFVNPLAFAVSGNNSLAYVLGNLGYDVWLISFRGTKYSRKHKYIKKAKEYWKGVTFDEQGRYDIKSSLDLVYNITKQKSSYIGWSMGTTDSYVYCSVEVQSCKNRLIGVISLAPIAFLKHVRGPIKLIWIAPLWAIENFFLQLFFDGRVPGTFFGPLFRLASKSPLLQFIISTVASQLPIHALFSLDPKSSSITIKKIIDDTGARTNTHYSQIYTSGKFRKFDYGANNNVKLYHSEVPPDYPLRSIPVPVVLFTGKGDYIASTETSDAIYSSLNETSRCGKYFIGNEYTHFDVVINKDNQDLLNKPLIRKLAELEKGLCIE